MTATSEPERWLSGDVVLAADGQLWRRSSAESLEEGYLWAETCSDSPDEFHDDRPVRPLTLLVRDGKPAGPSLEQLNKMRELLLAGGGSFDDDHTYDAHRLARIAELIGLHVVYEPCDGCGNKPRPKRIQVGSDG